MEICGIKMDLLDKEIQEYVSKFQMTYFDAVIHAAYVRNIDVELLCTKLSEPIKARLFGEANKNNLLKKKYEELPF